MGTAITGTQMRTPKASVVTELPDKGVSNKIYYVPNGTIGDNKYDEYLWIKNVEHPNGYFEKVGQKDINLEPYALKDYVDKKDKSITDKLTNSYYNKTQTDTKLDTKVDKVTGKNLSTNDFTDSYKNSLDNWFNRSSVKPTMTLADLENKKDIPTGVYPIGDGNGIWKYLVAFPRTLAGTASIELLANYAKSSLKYRLYTKDWDRISTWKTLATTAVATSTSDGLMSKEDKVKLDSLSLKEQLFIDMWNSACGTYGKYNAETGFYELNGLTDITYEQALAIYANTCGAKGSGLGGVFRGLRIRTHLPFQKLPGESVGGVLASYIFAESNVEIVIMNGAQINTGVSAFEGCSKLKLLENASCYRNTSGNYVNFFRGCVALENVSMNICSDFSFVDSPLLTYACMRNIISYSRNQEDITIILHPTTYAYLQGTTPPTEQVGGTTEQWQALVTAATNKKISFATTE